MTTISTGPRAAPHGAGPSGSASATAPAGAAGAQPAADAFAALLESLSALAPPASAGADLQAEALAKDAAQPGEAGFAGGLSAQMLLPEASFAALALVQPPLVALSAAPSLGAAGGAGGAGGIGGAAALLQADPTLSAASLTTTRDTTGGLPQLPLSAAGLLAAADLPLPAGARLVGEAQAALAAKLVRDLTVDLAPQSPPTAGSPSAAGPSALTGSWLAGDPHAAFAAAGLLRAEEAGALSAMPLAETMALPLAAGQPAAELALTRGAAGAPVYQAALASQPGEAAFAGDLTAQVRVLVAGGLQQAELRLNPADLGPIHIHLSMSSQTADISFAATNSITRDGIAQALPALREMLASQGLALGQAGVASGQDGRPSPQASRDPRTAPAPASGSTPATGAVLGGVATVRAGRGMLDLYA